MIQITEGSIDVSDVLASVADQKAGASVHFIGTVREEPGIKGLRYEYYKGMTEKLLCEIVEEAKKRSPLRKVSVVHRVGWVPIGEVSVVVAVSSAHRHEAFEACRFLIEEIKQKVPIWKRNLPVVPITGVILAGGRSSRFGSNKAFATYEGIPLIDRVVNVMSPLFQKLVIVTNNPAEYERLHLPLLRDLEPYKGPLGGIYTALRQTSNDTLFVVGCDMPLLSEEVIRKIIEQGKGADAAVPVWENNREYLMALYSRRLLPLFGRFLREGRLSLRGLCGEVNNIVWVPIDGKLAWNVNTEGDLRELEATDVIGPL